MAPSRASAPASCRPSSSGRAASPTAGRADAPRAVGRGDDRLHLERGAATWTARAPSGSWQPPPSAATTARSASKLAAAAGIIDRPQTGGAGRRAASRSRRCPGRAPECSRRREIAAEMRAPWPSRFSPATASTSASNSPASSFLQPRVDVAANRRGTARAGTAPRSCALRRHAAASRSPAPRARRPGRAHGLRGSTSASRGSSRGSTARDRRARRAASPTCPSRCGRRDRWRRARSASSISLTKSPLPPASESGASCRRSPAVLMTQISLARP